MINTISGGPHPPKKCWNWMEPYVSSLRHVTQETCFAIEDETPTKQHRMINDDTVFGNRDVCRMEAPTFEAMAITIIVEPTTVHRVLNDRESSVNILLKDF